VISVDLQRNEAASVNITVDPAAQSMVDQEQGLLKEYNLLGIKFL
jgi:hypothetical protein